MNRLYRVIIFTSLAILLLSITYILINGKNRDNSALEATSEYFLENPVPIPSFIHSIRVVNQPDAALMCLIIWQGVFWDETDDSAELQSHLINSSTLKINNDYLQDKSSTLFGMFPRDEKGNITEDFGSDIEFCYATNLNPGIYMATFETSSLDGVAFTYSWGFRVTEDGIDIGSLENSFNR